MTNLESILKSRDITLPTKAHLVKAMVFPVVTYGCESWTIKKAEHRIDGFELWCWRRLLRVLWTARRSNWSILKEISTRRSPLLPRAVDLAVPPAHCLSRHSDWPLASRACDWCPGRGDHLPLARRRRPSSRRPEGASLSAPQPPPPASSSQPLASQSAPRPTGTCQALVRFFALHRINPHAPPLVRAPVNFFEF